MQFNSISDRIIFFIVFLFTFFWFVIIPVKIYLERRRHPERDRLHYRFFLAGPALFLIYLVVVPGMTFLEKMNRFKAEKLLNPLIENALKKDRTAAGDSVSLDGKYILYQMNESVCAPKGILFWVANPGFLSYRVTASGMVTRPWKDPGAIETIIFLAPSVMPVDPVDELLMADSLSGQPWKPGRRKAGVIYTDYSIQLWFYSLKSERFFYSELLTSRPSDAGLENLYERMLHRLSDLYEAGTGKR
jgi:hypothetical protein